jgi:hypothetical protein
MEASSFEGFDHFFRIGQPARETREPQLARFLYALRVSILGCLSGSTDPEISGSRLERLNNH